MKKLDVGLIQSVVTADNQVNFEHIESLIDKAMHDDPIPQILCLPERWYFVDLINTPIEQNLQETGGDQLTMIQNWAKKYQVGIISGGIWEARENNLAAICAYYVDSNGEVRFSQDKIHLYGLEKKFFTPGQELVIFTDTNLDLTFSILICFDLNISPELTQLAVDNGAEIIFSPTLIRDIGMENWSIYIRARALENRVPVVACNSIFAYFDRRFTGNSQSIQFQVGEHSPVRLDPVQLNDEPGVLLTTVNLEFPNEIRHERREERIDLSGLSIIKKHS